LSAHLALALIPAWATLTIIASGIAALPKKTELRASGGRRIWVAAGALGVGVFLAIPGVFAFHVRGMASWWPAVVTIRRGLPEVEVPTQADWIELQSDAPRLFRLGRSTQAVRSGATLLRNPWYRGKWVDVCVAEQRVRVDCVWMSGVTDAGGVYRGALRAPDGSTVARAEVGVAPVAPEPRWVEWWRTSADGLLKGKATADTARDAQLVTLVEGKVDVEIEAPPGAKLDLVLRVERREVVLPDPRCVRDAGVCVLR
jgi:hypothetical protein